MGLFPEDTECAPRNTEPGFDVPAWDDLADEQKKLFARYMEVYAASLDNVDQNLRRLMDYLKVLGEYENTIIVFTSDNGGTSEGGDTGTRSYFSRFGAPKAGLPEGWTDDVPRDPALIGGPQTYAQHPRGWASAANTPFRRGRDQLRKRAARAARHVSAAATAAADRGQLAHALRWHGAPGTFKHLQHVLARPRRVLHRAHGQFDRLLR